jgi:hypothetical protein
MEHFRKFKVGDTIQCKKHIADHPPWNTKDYHNPKTEGNSFVIVAYRLGFYYLQGFRGAAGPLSPHFIETTFELAKTIQDPILARIQKLYSKCKTTQHWKVGESVCVTKAP